MGHVGDVICVPALPDNADAGMPRNAVVELLRVRMGNEAPVWRLFAAAVFVMRVLAVP